MVASSMAPSAEVSEQMTAKLFETLDVDHDGKVSRLPPCERHGSPTTRTLAASIPVLMLTTPTPSRSPHPRPHPHGKVTVTEWARVFAASELQRKQGRGAEAFDGVAAAS